MSVDEGMWLVSVIGLSNIFLRFSIGIMVTLLPVFHASRVTAVALILNGAATIYAAFYPKDPFLYQAIYCSFVALGNGWYFFFFIYISSLLVLTMELRFMILNLEKAHESQFITFSSFFPFHRLSDVTTCDCICRDNGH